MIKHFLSAALTAGLLSGCAGITDTNNTGTTGNTQGVGSGLYNPEQLVNAVREALKLSASRASDTLSQEGAYQSSPVFHIGLPDSVREISDTLKQFGLGAPLDQLETAMNRAAELAAGEAKSALLTAVSNMQLNDTIGIVRGGETAATNYFESATRNDLTGKYRAIVEEQLRKVSFYPTYQSLLNVYDRLPISDKPVLDLEALTVQRGLDALYAQIAEEEKKIRANPVEQGSLLISSVFGG